MSFTCSPSLTRSSTGTLGGGIGAGSSARSNKVRAAKQRAKRVFILDVILEFQATGGTPSEARGELRCWPVKLYCTAWEAVARVRGQFRPSRHCRRLFKRTLGKSKNLVHLLLAG